MFCRVKGSELKTIPRWRNRLEGRWIGSARKIFGNEEVIWMPHPPLRPSNPLGSEANEIQVWTLRQHCGCVSIRSTDLQGFLCSAFEYLNIPISSLWESCFLLPNLRQYWLSELITLTANLPNERNPLRPKVRWTSRFGEECISAAVSGHLVPHTRSDLTL